MLGGDGIRTERTATEHATAGRTTIDRTAAEQRLDMIQAGHARVDTLREGEDVLIPVVQETVRIEKRAVESGRVVVHKTTVERDETVEAMLLREDLQVERVPVGRVVTEALAPRRDGDVLIVPILEEVLVTEKRLVLKEELHIRTVRSEQAVTETVRLRSEQVTVEQTGEDGMTHAAPVATTHQGDNR